MMSPEGRRDSGGEFPLTEWSRLELLAVLAARVAQAQDQNASAERVRRPELAAVVGALGEADPGERPEITSHLRRMATVVYAMYVDEDRERPELDEEFYDSVGQTLGGEMDELRILAQSWHMTELPYPWGIAYEDVQALEDSGGVP